MEPMFRIIAPLVLTVDQIDLSQEIRVDFANQQLSSKLAESAGAFVISGECRAD